MANSKTNVQVKRTLLKKLKLLKITTDSRTINDTIEMLMHQYNGKQ